MTTYSVYLIKKVAQAVTIEADSVAEAEEKGYQLLANESFQNPTDPDWDRYVYCEGEV